MTIIVTSHAEKRMEQYGLSDNERLRDFLENAEFQIYDKKHDSKLIIINKAGHAAAIKYNSGERVVVTILPPPRYSWESRLIDNPDRYSAIDPRLCAFK
jgi:hypothetical protein